MPPFWSPGREACTPSTAGNLWHSPATNSKHCCQYHKPMLLLQNILTASISFIPLAISLQWILIIYGFSPPPQQQKHYMTFQHFHLKENEGEWIALFKNQPYNVYLTESYLTSLMQSYHHQKKNPAFQSSPFIIIKWVIDIINILPSWKECTSTLQLK